MDVWISPDEKIKKVILVKGTGTSKPTENCECNVLFTNATTTFKFNNDIICIGDSDGECGQLLDIVLQTMQTNEKAQVTFKTADVIEFTVELLSFSSHGLLYEWNAKYKYDLAFSHKLKGNEWFQNEEYEKASHRFSKGLKLLLSIPIDVENVPEEIDAIKLTDIEALATNLYNNLASCYLKVRNYSQVIRLCEIVLNNQKDVKAFYKMGVAYFEMNDFESALAALKNVLELDPGNKAAISKIKIVNRRLDEGNNKYVEIVKRMFP